MEEAFLYKKARPVREHRTDLNLTLLVVKKVLNI